MNLKNIELFCPESNKSNLVNHCEGYGKKEVERVGSNYKTEELYVSDGKKGTQEGGCRQEALL